jgi:hypothetical protein
MQNTRKTERNFKRIAMNRMFLLGALFSLIFVSCNRNPLKLYVSNQKINLKVAHFDADILHIDPEQIGEKTEFLQKKYGEFFDIFNYQMIRIGGTDQPNYTELLAGFVTDTLIQRLQKDVAAKSIRPNYPLNLIICSGITNTISPKRKSRQFTPAFPVLNQSIVTSTGLIGISLDKYLGADCTYYPQLGLPNYKIRNMYPGKITSDVAYAWAMTEFPLPENSNNLLAQMIYEGKLIYFTQAMLPDLPDSVIIGYSQKQLDFCRQNEAKMWTYLAEQKLLFSTDRMTIKRFIGDGPYTNPFTPESPGRAGVWIGWQIVRSYMKANKACRYRH